MNQIFDQIKKFKKKPSDFLRYRHPEQFSDSREKAIIEIPIEQFDYFLETITQRSQEKDFEIFCRLLAQKEICPNLTFQTGPTGGGDSKVDSETYPVSDDISLKWYEGIGRKSASERWAFAISAKKDWKSKIKNDVKSIVFTGRNYKKIYFMSNQAISDKKRAATEDSLREEYGISIHILDKLWIIEKVYSNKRFDIAVSALNIPFHEKKKKKMGPGDTEKFAELEIVEKNIDEFSLTANGKYQFIEDCLYAAILSRELEKPKIDVYGRFDRAKRAAQEFGFNIQLKKIIYQYAWTAYWWFEDFNYFNKLYNELEDLSIDSDNIWDLERLCTLWTLLQSIVICDCLTSDESKVDEKFNSLAHSLKIISEDNARPNASITAKLNLSLLKLVKAFRNKSALASIFSELEDILKSTEGLMDVPVNRLIEIIEDLSDFLGEEDSFDSLFEKIIEISEKRLGNGEKGRLLIKNGIRKLRCEKNNEAIKYFGRATNYLTQYEHRADFIMAQSSIGLAYENIGLMWAARASYAFAVIQVSNYFVEDGVMPLVMSTLLNHLIWIEIKLGRIPYALTWLNHKNLIDSEILALEPCDDLKDENHQIDSILGILILKTRYDDLNKLAYLPSLLDRFGLYCSKLAALYALGYEDAVKYESESKICDLFEFFTNWLNQPANTELPLNSEWNVTDKILLESSVLGLKFSINLPNDTNLLTFAEGILSSIECFLATGLSHEIFPQTPIVKIILALDNSIDKITLKEEEDDYGEITFMILVPNEDVVNQVQDLRIIKLISSIVIRIIAKNIMNYNFDEVKKMIIEDLAFERMEQFIQFPLIISNILGSNIQSSIKQWEPLAGPERFALLRIKPWSDSLYHSNSFFDTGGLKKENNSQIKLSDKRHSEITFESIINQRLWDKAEWSAVLYACLPGNPIKLVLGICFKQKEEALKIFNGWKKKIGNEDINEIINISIITRINRNDPYRYRVLICPKINSLDPEKSKYLMFSARFHDMAPNSAENLNNFRRSIGLGFGYYLAPAIYDGENLTTPLVDEKYWIKKNKINIIEAWKVKENDVEAIAITPDLNIDYPQ